ncbi:hypothetical protein L1049_001553 [Liquidambar formosana]|uniref:Small ribosomal subunit protein uS17 N-terminal domain-containing protein n=1 Tax=Liquidambar formosana TaxID=63359 RepID=A0AAP0R5K5_LIQFO
MRQRVLSNATNRDWKFQIMILTESKEAFLLQVNRGANHSSLYYVMLFQLGTAEQEIWPKSKSTFPDVPQSLTLGVSLNSAQPHPSSNSAQLGQPKRHPISHTISLNWVRVSSAALPLCIHLKESSIMAEQTEKAFLKQPKVFLCSKKSGKGKRPGKGGNRFWKSVGLGFKTPRDAIEGTYIDKKCPFTGNVSIRGRILTGNCHSAKMMRTIIVRRNYLHFVKKYQRYEKRHSNIPAHVSPCFRVKEGDHVIIGQCRPLSKTVRFNVLKVIPAGSSGGGGKKAFAAM